MHPNLFSVEVDANHHRTESARRAERACAAQVASAAQGKRRAGRRRGAIARLFPVGR